MELTPSEQIKKIVNEAKEILITAAVKDNLDSLGSLLAFHQILQKINKKNTLAAKVLENNYHFLPASTFIQPDLKGAKDFVISLDISKTKVEQFKYSVKDNKLNIYITPKEGSFEPHDVETKKGKSKYDLIIALNTPSLENLQGIYADNAEIFYESPLVNIDHHANNENFGEINLVETAASSTAEILFYLFKQWDQNLLDAATATCLLSGILGETESFQASNTTPRALQAAAHLVEKGAEHNLIVQNLYKSHPLSVLRLWGRALARIKTAFEQKIIWSILAPIDFEKSGAILKNTDDILTELRNSTKKAEIVFLLAAEKAGLVYLKIQQNNKNINFTALKESLIKQNFQLKNEGQNILVFSKENGDLALQEKNILEEMKKVIPTEK